MVIVERKDMTQEPDHVQDQFSNFPIFQFTHRKRVIGT